MPIMIKFTAPEDLIVRMTNEVTNELNDKERNMLALLSENPKYTLLQLAEKTGMSRKSVAGYLKKLKEKNIIERVGTKRSGYWKINNR